MRVTACLAALIVVTAMVASAQTPPPAKPAKTEGLACTLLTKEDAAAALGEAATGPKATVMPNGPSSCEYTGSGLHRVQLTVRPMDAQTVGVYKAMCAKMKKDGLTGLGDVTCWYDDKHAELQVVKGMTFFSIDLQRSGDPTEPIKAVARKVYDRLK